MAGYPIAWTDRWASFDPSAVASLHTAEEISAYLADCRTSPFVAGKQNVDRWLYAQTNDDGLSAEEFLEQEIAKHP